MYIDECKAKISITKQDAWDLALGQVHMLKQYNKTKMNQFNNFEKYWEEVKNIEDNNEMIDRTIYLLGLTGHPEGTYYIKNELKYEFEKNKGENKWQL